MLHAFTDAKPEVQVQICSGDISPWAEPCPVIHECLEWFIRRCHEVDGNQQAYDNVLAHGGLTPRELLKVVQNATKRKIEGLQPVETVVGLPSTARNTRSNEEERT